MNEFNWKKNGVCLCYRCALTRSYRAKECRRWHEHELTWTACARALRRFPFALHCTGSTRFEQPLRSVDQAMGGGVDLRYYSTPVHAAAFVLPEFARRLFG